MKFAIEVFDRETEELREIIEIPSTRQAELADLMEWKDPADAIYVYDLSAEQLSQIEKWTGKKFTEARHIIQLACIA